MARIASRTDPSYAKSERANLNGGIVAQEAQAESVSPVGPFPAKAPQTGHSPPFQPGQLRMSAADGPRCDAGKSAPKPKKPARREAATLCRIPSRGRSAGSADGSGRGVLPSSVIDGVGVPGVAIGTPGGPLDRGFSAFRAAERDEVAALVSEGALVVL